MCIEEHQRSWIDFDTTPEKPFSILHCGPPKLSIDLIYITYTSTMAKKAIQKDQIVKLIVGAGQASPSPPVGPALGSKGVKSMDFCKVTSTPIPMRFAQQLTSRNRNSTRAQHTTTPAPQSPPASPCAQTAPSTSACARRRPQHSCYPRQAWRRQRARSAAREMSRGR